MADKKQDPKKPETGLNTLKPMDAKSLNAIPEHLQGTAGQGNENVGMEDASIARLNIAQALSPQVNKAKAEYIQGLEQGDVFNTLTKEVVGRPFYWIDVAFRKTWTVAVDRKINANGGILANFDTEAEAQNFAATQPNAQELEVVETPIHAGLVLNAEGKVLTEALIYMAKGKRKASRDLNGELMKLPAARWGITWRVDTFLDTGKKSGKDFFNLKFEKAAWTPAPLVELAKKLAENFAKMTVKVVDADMADPDAAASDAPAGLRDKI